MLAQECLLPKATKSLYFVLPSTGGVMWHFCRGFASLLNSCLSSIVHAFFRLSQRSRFSTTAILFSATLRYSRRFSRRRFSSRSARKEPSSIFFCADLHNICNHRYCCSSRSIRRPHLRMLTRELVMFYGQLRLFCTSTVRPASKTHQSGCFAAEEFLDLCTNGQ